MNDVRHDWTKEEVKDLFDLPFSELLLQAHLMHRKYFDPNAVQVSTLLSIKTGACPEDCAYCPQSGHYNTGLQKEKLLSVDEVIAAAKKAKANGATRFCMGAAWRNPPKKDFPKVLEMIKAVKALNMETCVTIGMLSAEQVAGLEESGLDFYNHNLDTSPEYYSEIISTRDYEERLDTLEKVRCSKINVCCGGIIGMGESAEDRIGLLVQLANLPEHPKSVPINLLVKIAGTPLENEKSVHPIDFARMVAVARVMMPQSMVRLSAGRAEMSAELHALCFFAGANSIHYGEKLLTTPLPDTSKDQLLLKKLGVHAYPSKQQEEYANA